MSAGTKRGQELLGDGGGSTNGTLRSYAEGDMGTGEAGHRDDSPAGEKEANPRGERERSRSRTPPREMAAADLLDESYAKARAKTQCKICRKDHPKDDCATLRSLIEKGLVRGQGDVYYRNNYPLLVTEGNCVEDAWIIDELKEVERGITPERKAQLWIFGRKCNQANVDYWRGKAEALKDLQHEENEWAMLGIEMAKIPQRKEGSSGSGSGRGRGSYRGGRGRGGNFGRGRGGNFGSDRKRPY